MLIEALRVTTFAMTSVVRISACRRKAHCLAVARTCSREVVAWGSRGNTEFPVLDRGVRVRVGPFKQEGGPVLVRNVLLQPRLDGRLQVDAE